MMSLSKMGKAMRIALLIQSPVWLIVSLATGIYTWSFLSHCISACGTVVDNARIEPTPDQPATGATFAPVFRFTTRDGQIHNVTSSTSANPPSYAIGQPVKVLYLEGKPNGARIDSVGDQWGFTIGFAIGGAATGVCGAGLSWYERRKHNYRTA